MVCGHKSFCHIFSFKEDLTCSPEHIYAYNCVACLAELVRNDCIPRSNKQQHLRKFYEFSQTACFFVDKLENVAKILLSVIDVLVIDLNSDYSEYVDTVIAVLQLFFKLLSPNEDFVLCGINSLFTLVHLDSSTSNESCLINSITVMRKVLEIADTSWNNLTTKICEFFISLLPSRFENVIVACFQGLEICFRSPSFFHSIGLNSFDKVFAAMINMRKNKFAIITGFSCLLRLACQKDCFKLFTHSEKFGKLTRLLLNSHECEVQHAVVNLLWVLLKNDEGLFCARYLYVTGILEFLYDILTPQKPYLNELHDILEVFGSDDECNTSSLLPQVLDRFINVIEYLLEKKSPLIVKYCTLLCENIQNYRGVVDLFITSHMQEKFLTLTKELLLSRNIHVCSSAISCISSVMRCNRLVLPVPVLLVIQIIKAASKGAEHYLLLKSESKVDFTTKETANDMLIKEQKSSFLTLYVEFCFMVHQKFLLEKNVDMSKHCGQYQYFSELFVRLFFGRYLEAFSSVTSALIPDENFMQSFTQLLSLYCVLLMQCHFENTLVNMQVVPVKASVGTIFDPDTKRLIRKCFTCALPMLYRFCFMKKNLLRSKSLLSSRDAFIHAGRNLERQLSTLPETNSNIFMDEYVYLELIALMTLMEATKVYEGYEGKLKNDNEATEILQTFEILKEGTSSIQAADYYSLAEHLRSDSNNILSDHIAASALGITCTLMNRSINFFELKIYPDRKACYEAPEVHCTLADRLLCVPETLLEQLLLFPVKAGVAYFLTLPVFFTIQLLLTYTTFENHFLTRLDVSPVERKISLTHSWNVLASALIDRLTPRRTQLLLRCPGFSAQLQRADLVWVKLAQQMIMHCHWDDELYEQNTSELLHKSYTSAANIWTVWINTFIKGENEVLLKRLTATVKKTIVTLQRIGELSEEIRVSRREFTFYVADSLISSSTHLPCTLAEFLAHRVTDAFIDTYVEVLECFTEALIKELCADASRALRWIQLIFELLSNATCLKGGRTRHRLLTLILCFLINSEDLLFVQVVKLLFSALCVHDTLHCFYVESGLGGNEDVLSSHAQRYSIGPEEVENIMCIGAIVTGCYRTLPPVQFSNQFDKVIFLHAEVVLNILKSSVPSLANTQKIQAAALLCLLHSSDIPGCHKLWPTCDSEEHVNYYCELALCLYTFMMDPVEEFLRYLSMRTYDVLLSKTASNPEGSFDIGDKLIHSPWNSILIEQLQAETIGEDLQYQSSQFVDFVTTLVRTNNPEIFLLIEKRILVRLLTSYAHSELLECTDNVLNNLRKFAFEISKADNLGLLSESEHVCIQIKLQLDSKPNSTPNTLELFRSFLKQPSTA